MRINTPSLAEERISAFSFLKELCSQVFEISLYTIPSLFITNVIADRILEFHFDLELLFIIPIASGILSNIPDQKSNVRPLKRLSKMNLFFLILLFSIAVTLEVFDRLDTPSSARLWVALVAGISFLLIGFLFSCPSSKSD